MYLLHLKQVRNNFKNQKNMKIKVLSFSGENFSHNTVTSLTVMTKSGEVTILDNHSPMIASIEPCVLYIRYKDENNMVQRDDFAV